MKLYIQVPEEDLTDFIKLMQKNHIEFKADGEGFYKTKKGKTIYQFWCEKTRGKGRPRKQVDVEKVQALKKEGKTVKEICEILNLKRATYYNYMSK